MFNLIKKLAMACALALIASAGSIHAQTKPTLIGFLYPSPIGDVGWSKQLELAREAVDKAFGDKVVTRSIDNVPEGPNASRIINQMLSDGAKFVVLGSFGYANDGLRLARQYPDTAFLHASGFRQTKNLGTFTARSYEGFYLAGMAGGMLTKVNTIGIVAAFAVPEVVAEINAITLAVQRVNPQAKIRIVWVNSWFDPAKEQDAARALIAQGADVLFSLHQDTPSVVNVAQANKVWVANVSSDMSAHGPDVVMASVTTDWSKYIVKEVGDKLAGKFKSSDFRGGLAADVVKLVWHKDIPPAQLAQIQAVEADLRSGKAHVFAGPLRDQSGKERVAAGAVLSDADIFSMNWLVQGLDGTLPN